MMNPLFFKGLTKFVLVVVLLANVPVYAEEPASEISAKITKECADNVAGLEPGHYTKEDCIVRNFKDSPQAAIIRGKIAYGHYCILCHGATGQGDGRAAKLHTPRPANLTKSVYPPDYMSMMVRKGGEAMGRSPAMPPWGEQLTDEQIRDIVNYVISIRQIAVPPQQVQ